MNNISVIRRSIYTSFKMYQVQYPIKFQLTTLIPRIFFQLVFFTLLGSYIGGKDLMNFVLIGNAVFIIVSRLIILIPNQIQLDIVTNIFDSIMISPANKFIIYFGKSIIFIFEGIINSTVALLVVIGISESVKLEWSFLWVLIVLIVISLSVSFFGLLIGIFTSKNNKSIIISNVFGMTMLLMCGVNFNINILPYGLSKLSSILPLTNGLIAIRFFLQNRVSDGILYMSYEIVLMLIYGIFAIVFVNRLEKIVKKGD